MLKRERTTRRGPDVVGPKERRRESPRLRRTLNFLRWREGLMLPRRPRCHVPETQRRFGAELEDLLRS